MLRFSMTYHPIEFDGDTYMRDLDRAIRKLMREAARKWLITVLNTIESAGKDRGDPYTIGDSFPIVTGEAKGSLIPLGRMLHVDVPVRPKPGRPNRIAKGMGQASYIYPREQSGAGAIQADYVFNFQTHVAHFRVNELVPEATKRKNLLSQTPWHVFETANKVFEDFMNSHLIQQVPRLNSYFYTGRRTTHGVRFTSPTFQR